MSAFMAIELKPHLDENEIYKQMLEALPEFQWRRGDSDLQGKYISGKAKDKRHIQLWLSDDPIDVTISFRSADEHEWSPERRDQFCDWMAKKLLPMLGSIQNIRDYPV